MSIITGSITFTDGSTQTTKFDSTNDTGKVKSISSYITAGTYTWTKPSGCTSVLVKVVGGGGGAAGYCESGGGGGYSEKIIDVSSVTTVSVTVGGGGSAVGYSAAAGDGSTSSFGSYCSASGGYGANRNYGHTGGLPGVGSNGDINLHGGMGTGHANVMSSGALGRGGDTYLGGGRGPNRVTSGGVVGPGAPGSGGSGWRTNASGTGTPGNAGAVIILEFS